MLGRVVAVIAIAVVAGLAISLRDLVLARRGGPLPADVLLLPAFALALATAGWFATQGLGVPLGILAAPLAAALVVGVAVAAKQLRYPHAPLVGDGFEILLVVYAAVGLAAGAVGALPRLRARSLGHAVAIAIPLILIAGALFALPYLLP